MDCSSYVIVGKVVYSGLDCEGNLHLVLRNSNSFWAERAATFLRSLEGHVVAVKVRPWRASTFKHSRIKAEGERGAGSNKTLDKRDQRRGRVVR